MVSVFLADYGWFLLEKTGKQEDLEKKTKGLETMDIAVRSVKMEMTIWTVLKKNKGEAEESGVKRKREMRNELGVSAKPDERRWEVNTGE